jgi:hypothetical protein
MNCNSVMADGPALYAPQRAGHAGTVRELLRFDCASIGTEPAYRHTTIENADRVQWA